MGKLEDRLPPSAAPSASSSTWREELLESSQLLKLGEPPASRPLSAPAPCFFHHQRGKSRSSRGGEFGQTHISDRTLEKYFLNFQLFECLLKTILGIDAAEGLKLQ